MWRPCVGLALTVATRLGVKLGTVVETRARSKSLWSALMVMEVEPGSRQDVLLPTLKVTLPEGRRPNAAIIHAHETKNGAS